MDKVLRADRALSFSVSMREPPLSVLSPAPGDIQPSEFLYVRPLLLAALSVAEAFEP
jgi:hypothetical protein